MSALTTPKCKQPSQARATGTTHVVWGMLYGLTQWGVTVAEVLSDAGYAEL